MTESIDFAEASLRQFQKLANDARRLQEQYTKLLEEAKAMNAGLLRKMRNR